MNKKTRKALIIGIPVLAVISIGVITLFVLLNWQTPEQKRLKRIRSGEEELNIILISIDTTRADRIGCYGFEGIDTPNIDRLAERGVRFAQCKAQVPLTLPSHTTMLTGSYPPFTGVRTNDIHVPDDTVVSLPEVLGPEGYDSAAFISSMVLFAETGIDQGFDYYDDETRPPTTWQDIKPNQRRAETTWESAKKWLKERDNADPFFMFLHFYDPHSGYHPPPPFSSRYKETPYVGEIAYVDLVLGDLIPALKREGYYENTLIILVGDHGENLGEHGEKEHGVFVYESAMHVPMIFYCPGLIPQGEVVEDPVAIADVAPTIYDILGVEMPDVVQGESLVPQMFGKKRPHRAIYEESLYMHRSFGWGSIYAIERDGYKYIECPKPELYNLCEDPDETENIIEMKPELAAEMSEELGKMLAAYSSGAREPGDETPDASELSEIAALGYFGGGVAEDVFAEIPTGEIEDCKDNIDIINTFTLGQMYELQGEHEKSIEIYKQALEKEPDSSFIYFLMTRTYAKSGNLPKAIEYAEKSLEAAPDNVSTKIGVADLYIQVKRYEDARTLISGLEDEKMSDKTKSRLYLNLSLISYYGFNDLKTATEQREKALELDPNNRKFYYDMVFLYAESKRYDEAEEAANKYIDMVNFGPNVEIMKIALLKIEQLRKDKP